MEISPTVALARAASTASASRLPLPRSAARVSASSASCKRGRIALGLQPRELVELHRAHGGIVDLEHVDRRFVGRLIFVDADHRLHAGIDARLRLGGGFLDAQLRECRPRSPWPCRRALRLPGYGPRPCAQARRSAARHNRSRPRDRRCGWCRFPAAARSGCCGRCGRRSRSAAPAPRRAHWCAATGCGPASPPSPRSWCARHC